MMISLQVLPGFDHEVAELVAGEVATSRLKQMFADLLTDERFLDAFHGSTSTLIKRLVQDDTLKDAFKEQFKESLQEPDLHRAGIRGALDAFPESFAKRVVQQYVAPPSSPPAQGASPPSPSEPAKSGFGQWLSDLRKRTSPPPEEDEPR